jgi:hypothetical protein
MKNLSFVEGCAEQLCVLQSWTPSQVPRTINISRGIRVKKYILKDKFFVPTHFSIFFQWYMSLLSNQKNVSCLFLNPHYFVYILVFIYQKQSLLRKLCIFIKHINKFFFLYSWPTRFCSLAY